MAAAFSSAEPFNRTAQPPRRRWWRWCVRAAGAAATAGLLWHFGFVFLGTNCHTVIAGQVYRCAQPDGPTLARLVRAYGIRTIINLRGTCQALDWYREEAAAAQQLDLNLEDINFSAGRRPSYHEIRELVEALDRAERPLLLHCRHGADRTGLAAALTLLLHTDTPYAVARRQLSLWYGHAPLGRATILDDFLDRYAKWLADQQRPHEPAALRHWLLQVYRGEPCQAVFEEVALLRSPVRVGEPIAYRVRVRNVSPRAWQFKPTRTAGFHLCYHVWEPSGKSAAFGHAGMFDRVVAPDESVAITLVVPPLSRPGRYKLFIDMVEMNQCSFFQAGSQPYEEDLDVRD
ncbi:MAG: tyrosine-protein phosphatase [Gemmataceae bacterium]|nr:tyrosine-protein phosphatase [Gemmataceae bacterium]